VKAVEGVTDIINIGGFNPLGGRKQPQGPTIVKVAFEQGDASLTPEDQQAIDSVIKLLRKDKNTQATIRSELGRDDVELAETRANPELEDCLALAGELRVRRAGLADARATLAARATGELGSSAEASGATIAQLQLLDRRIALTDEALDKLYDLLRPGADRQKSRRTRAAAIQIADQRLKLVREALIAANVPDGNERIQATAATFNPAESDDPGAINITVVQKKRQK
jgi:hypothetical protein